MRRHIQAIAAASSQSPVACDVVISGQPQRYTEKESAEVSEGGTLLQGNGVGYWGMRWDVQDNTN
jgi:hypothetical protein